ncbi:MAG: HD domain-containing protein [Bacteroidetes bacterium]|nr:HD domain-containing protein [Bacteroidota bacterium]
MDYPGAKKYILNRLENELGLNYFYHSVNHTLDVLRAATRLARTEGLDKHNQKLTETAALFHDAGMLNIYIEHEEESIKITSEVLPQFDYSEKDIRIINKMILTTKIPQNAETLLEKILCDADLDYLGRDDFFIIAQKLRYEWNIMKIHPTSLKQWFELQIDFMGNHKFYTPSAIKLRHDKKQNNLNQIKELLNHK